MSEVLFWVDGGGWGIILSEWMRVGMSGGGCSV